MQGLLTLLSLSIVMAAASFLAGILPLSINLSRERLRLISTVGMGVLVGTALIVIIPEGIDTMYRSGRTVQSASLLGRNVDYASISNVRSLLPSNEFVSRFADELDDLEGTASTAFDMPGLVIPDKLDEPPKTPTDPGVVGIMGTESKESGDHKEVDHSEGHHAWIGVALIAGFILMFLIDKLPQSATNARPKPRTHHISLNNLGGRFNLSTNIDRDEEAETFLENNQTAESRRHSFATTIGLVIHSAADGIALGASSSTGQSNLSLIIFFAIMLHKAPAAFGLTSLLLRQGLSKRMARAHLILFSLAAPCGAVLTWIVAGILGAHASSNAEHTQWWTGVLLLFSAGTFLYVAMHALQETTSGEPRDHGMNGQPNSATGEIHSAPDRAKPSMTELAAAVFGMILPLFLQIGHAH